MTEKLMEIHDLLWIVGCLGALVLMVAWFVCLVWCNVKVRRICETEPSPPEPVESYTFAAESPQGGRPMHVVIKDANHSTDEPIWEGDMTVLPAKGQILVVRGQHVTVDSSYLEVQSEEATIYVWNWEPPEPGSDRDA